MAAVSFHDVAIVPGNVFRNGRPNRLLEERLWLALGLYQAGRVGAFFVSGDEARAGHEASGMRQWLVDRGVPGSRVMVDELGIRTLATMARAAHVFGIRSAIVCTQRWAAPRALFLAHGAGMDAIAFVPPSKAPSSFGGAENLKIALAFVERYVLGRTSTVAAGTATVAMTALLR
jgi:SanA protein